jgi:uncharacterized protein YbaR (Trm112 family)
MEQINTTNPMSPYYDHKNDPEPVTITCPRCKEDITLDSDDRISQKQWQNTIMRCPECGDLYELQTFDIEDDINSSNFKKLYDWLNNTP